MEENILETQVIQKPTLIMSKPSAELNDSLITKMSNLQLGNESFGNNTKVSALTIATDHPLMNCEENYPDLIPKSKKELIDDSLLSIEDQSKETFYSPKRNTSKNNLYFNDISDGQNSNNILRIDMHHEKQTNGFEKNANDNRKCLASLCINSSTPRQGDSVTDDMFSKHITPIQTDQVIRSPDVEDYYTGLADWSGPAHSVPNFDLPMELSAGVGRHQEESPPPSPDGLSSSADRSSYQTSLDLRAGRAALRHTARRAAPAGRRRIMLPPETEDCSSDSASVSSLESEDGAPDAEEPPGQGDRAGASSPIPEYSLAEERRDARSWLAVPPPGRARCDLAVIEPYKRVLSHGGYAEAGSAIIVFSACHLPDRARADYHYVMDNLFLYIMVTLERLVSDEYILVYLHGSARRRLPTLHWLRHSYTLVDRRLRKSLKHLYLVHPTFWLKSIVVLCKPFVSSKFFRKLSYINNLQELMRRVPVEPNAIPDLVKEFDAAK